MPTAMAAGVASGMSQRTTMGTRPIVGLASGSPLEWAAPNPAGSGILSPRLIAPHSALTMPSALWRSMELK